VLALDIDHFKNVNDSWGHDVGDRVIQQVASTLRFSNWVSGSVCASELSRPILSCTRPMPVSSARLT
jgi:predicted signal transduction protein with EAL and GGDEF domain